MIFEKTVVRDTDSKIKDMAKVEFKSITKSETRFDYKGRKFLLVEADRGVCGLGRAVQLYLLDGLERRHIKEIGWVKADSPHNTYKYSNCDAYIVGITTMSEIKKQVTNYIDEFI